MRKETTKNIKVTNKEIRMKEKIINNKLRKEKNVNKISY